MVYKANKTASDEKEHQAFRDIGKLVASLGKARTRLVLEQRMVFDAAAGITGAEVAAEQIAQNQADIAAKSLTDKGDPINEVTAEKNQIASLDNFTPLTEYDSLSDFHNNTIDLSLAESLEELDALLLPDAEPTEIMFIDGGAAHVGDILQAIPGNVEVVLLDPSADGVKQLANTLENRSNIDAVRIISHGQTGQFNLGLSNLTPETMQGVYADALTTIGSSVSDHGNIFLYGCHFGEGTEGTEAVNVLAATTGVRITAFQEGAEETK